MKKQFAMILSAFLLLHTYASAYHLEVNLSYDYFRGLPDGSWNGNPGGYLAANFSTTAYKCVDVQLGGSYGLYNWDGRQNQVFASPQSLLQQGFLTTGFGFTYGAFHTVLVYDRMFTNNFGIFNLNPSFDQLRLKEGFRFRCEEIGIWGTVHLCTSNKEAVGLPISYRAIDQVNLFWTHFFSNDARTTLWVGLPYRHSLMYPGRTPGSFIAGFAARAPLGRCFFFDGYGSYMAARRTTPFRQSCNYGANVCVGVTYYFGETCFDDSNVLPVANNSYFMVDTNANN